MIFCFGVILSYLLGAIPTAYIFGRLYKGIDIREHGSGNVGATNVFRVLGKKPGAICLALDIIKGIIPVTVIPMILGITEIWQYIALGLVAVAGHNWTIFLSFKGGKGVATSLGILIGLAISFPSLMPVLIATVLIWVLCFVKSSIVSASSIIASITLPILMVMTNQPFEFISLGIVFCLFVVIRHKANIKRLLAGQEPRVPLPFKKNINS